MNYTNGHFPHAAHQGQAPIPPGSAPKIISDLERAINDLRVTQGQPPLTKVEQHLHVRDQPHAQNGNRPRGADPTFVAKAEAICKGIFRMLVDKNVSYGNSALDPIRIFSRAAADEQIKVRTDDKLSRIKNGNAYPGDNDVVDLIGYLILLLIANQNNDEHRQAEAAQ